MSRVVHSVLVAILVVLCCSLLPLSSAAVSQRLREVRLAQAREALLSPSTSRLSVGPGLQLDCPEAGDWMTKFSSNTTGIYGLAPLSGCILLIIVSQRPSRDNILLAIDVRNGSTLWSLTVSDGLSITALNALTVSLDVVYIRFRNFSQGDCEFSCDSIRAVALGEKPHVLWTVVLGESHHILQPLGSEGRTGEVLAAFSTEDDEEWVTIESRTRQVLYRGQQTSSYGLFVLGHPRDGRLLSTRGANQSAVVYQLQADGSFKMTGRTSWQGRQMISSVIYDFLERLPPQPSLLVSGSTSQLDSWQGVDAEHRQSPVGRAGPRRIHRQVGAPAWLPGRPAGSGHPSAEFVVGHGYHPCLQ